MVLCRRSKCKFGLPLVDDSVSCSLEDVYNGSVLSYEIASIVLSVCAIYIIWGVGGGGGICRICYMTGIGSFVGCVSINISA